LGSVGDTVLDSSGLASSLILSVSLLTFTYVSLIQSLQNWRGVTPAGIGLVEAISITSILSLAISSTALLMSISWMTWPLFLLSGILLLSVLITLKSISRYLTTNHYKTVVTITYSLNLKPKLPFLRYKGQAQMKSTDQPTLNALKTTQSTQIELDHMVLSDENQPIDDRERSMIRSILRLDEYNARDIMVPRVDVLAVDIEHDLADVANQMLMSGHSRLPVYRETLDNVIGIIHLRSLLPLLKTKPPWPSLGDLLKDPFFVPESKRLDELLSEFQKQRVQMALVVDEHGGVEGLVTLEDLLEEIVGEIEDEFSPSNEPPIAATDDGKLIVDARISLNDLEEHVHSRFNEVDVDTIGGLVYSSLGKIPKAGDEILYDGLKIKVLSTMGRRIRKLQVESTHGE